MQASVTFQDLPCVLQLATMRPTTLISNHAHRTILRSTYAAHMTNSMFLSAKAAHCLQAACHSSQHGVNQQNCPQPMSVLPQTRSTNAECAGVGRCVIACHIGLECTMWQEKRYRHITAIRKTLPCLVHVSCYAACCSNSAVHSLKLSTPQLRWRDCMISCSSSSYIC